MSVAPYHLFLAVVTPLGLVNWAVGRQITLRAMQLGERRERLRDDPRFKGLGKSRIGPDGARVHLVWSDPSDLPKDLQNLIRWERRLSTALALLMVGYVALLQLTR